MANSLNKVQLIGNLTADPEIKETPNGQKVASFSLATNKSWKDDNGQKQESVEFHSLVAWRGLATILEQYATKGKKLYVEGELKTRSWEDQAGVKRYKTEIVANNVILLSGGERRENLADAADEIYGDDFTPPPSRPAKKIPQDDISIDDIPF